MNREIFKKSDEELQGYLQFKRRGTLPKIKKGRGSTYSRKKYRPEISSEYDNESGMVRFTYYET